MGKMSPYVAPGLRPWGVLFIEKIVCEVFSLTADEIRSKTNSHKIVVPRQAVYYLSKKYLEGITYETLGKYFNQDHATAMHGRRQIINLIETRHPFSELIKTCEKTIENERNNFPVRENKREYGGTQTYREAKRMVHDL